MEGFGNKGRLEVTSAALHAKYPEKDPTGYQIAGPPSYFNDTLYFGLAQSDGHIPGGLVTAVDGRTGAVKWVFNTIHRRRATRAGRSRRTRGRAASAWGAACYTAKGVPMLPFCQTYPIINKPELAHRARQIYFPYSTKEAYILSHGGSSFGPPAFSPRTSLVYVTGKNAAVAFRVKPVGDTLRQSNEAIGHTANIEGGNSGIERGDDVGVPNTEAVTAFHPATGELIGQQVYPSRSSIGSTGRLASAGDLVFQGSDTGDFFAFDARSGAQAFKHTSPRSIRASPITYRANGKQFVAIVATNTALTFGLP